ncbi:hypothetical protein WOLCODRAFT_24290 [Wolfiporia cocos MD-104 SS10]|uniref:CASTOR ACT domain-containing protein n=1 Tax=Wolfiporia cocos (strain MD-104) TaxID=742152 RepID=A0A2H3JVS2_WOLCO|nr:hypothetical protein WOLCODRAFT_24290 [Wolfiporia cocos MD-104 SS10]
MSTPSDFSDPSDGPLSHSENAEDVKTPALPSRPVMSRAQSHSPSGCEVSLLTPDLTYVGLSDDNADIWGLKIIKLVSFPELIVGSIARTRTSTSSSQLFSAAPPGHRETAITAEEFVSTVDTQLQELSLNISAVSEGEGGTTSGSDTTTRVGPESPKDPELENVDSPVHDIHLDQLWHDDTDNASPDTGNTSEEDGSLAAASPRRHYSNDFPAVNILPHDYDSKRDRSYSEPTTGRPPLAHYDTFDTFTTVDTVRPSRSRDASKSGSQSRSASASSATSSSAGIPSAPPLVPFFSFTRTPEGSSLTAPVSLLAALFPPDERDMVICRAELDVLDSREASPTADDEDVDEHEDEVDDDEPQGPLRCLQIDLRKFGLDKHGLVNRFSRTLEENGINHMYNSTYKTANLLVDKAHATRAQALLRSC